MATQNKIPFDQIVFEALKKEITNTIEAEYENVKKDFITNLEREKSKTIASIAINVMKLVDFNMMQDRLVLTIRNEKGNE